MRAPRYALLGGIAMVLLFSACGEDSPLAPSTPPPAPKPPPTPAPAPEDYPLALGNRWEYDRALDILYVDIGGVEVLPPYIGRGRAYREIISEEVIGGRTYMVEWERFIIDGAPPDTVDTWERFRQDSTGLYRAAVDERIAPGMIPPDSVVGEAVLLAYPLEVGATWNRAGFTYANMTVEAEDTVAVGGEEFVAWRLRIDYQSARPNDYAYDWFALPGLASSVRHGEINAMDPLTGDIIVIMRHETWGLTSFTPGAGAFAAAARRETWP